MPLDIKREETSRLEATEPLIWWLMRWLTGTDTVTDCGAATPRYGNLAPNPQVFLF